MVLFSTLPGGLVPTPGEVRANAMAGRAHAAERDLPDPLAWEDYADAPRLTFEVIRRRIAEDRLPSVVCSFPLPKAWGGRTRTMSCTDELDDLVLRVLAGRCAPAVDARLRDSVVRGRVVRRPPGWRIEPWRAAHAARTETALGWLDDGTEWFAAIDALEYFPRILPEGLVGRLRRMCAPTGAAIAIGQLLLAFSRNGGPGGLPIGSESSTLLANVPLAHGDRVLAAACIPFTRLVDDTWLRPNSPEQWEEIIERYRTAVRPAGVLLHPEKTRLMQAEAGRAQVVNPVTDYVTGGGTINIDAEEAAELLEAELADDDPDGGVVRFSLGGLRRHRALAGIGILEADPHLLDFEPKATADYLIEVLQTRKGRRRIDLDFLLERACRPPADLTVAGQLQTARVLAVKGVNKAQGRVLADFAEKLEVRAKPPLRAWILTAWGRSRAWKPGLAVEQAEADDQFGVRRALVGTLRTSSPSPRLAKAAVHLTTIERDLAPTVEWSMS
jgi:hypothetical protein